MFNQKNRKMAFAMAVVCSLSFASLAEAQTKKRRTDSSAASASPARTSNDGRPYGVAGCGLGNYVFKDKTSKVQQILAATTNGTSGNQTFGISTGTLNCEIDGVVAKHAEQEVFVAANYDALSRDIATGRGESLEAFASLMGCNKADSHEFARAARLNHDVIFGNTTAKDATVVVRNVREMISRDAKLAAACGTHVVAGN